MLSVGCNYQNQSNKIEGNSVDENTQGIFHSESKRSVITIAIKKPFPNVPIILYEPIDGACNFSFYQPENKIQVKKDTVIHFERNLNAPNTYIVQYGVARAIVNIFPADSVNIAFEGRSNGYNMNFSGSDSLFHKKYNEGAYSMFMGSGFDTVVSKIPQPPKVMAAKINDYINRKTSFLDSLYNEKKITQPKRDYFYKLYAYSVAAICTNPISMYYIKPNTDPGWLNELYSNYPPFDSVVVKCLYGNSYVRKYVYDIQNKRTTVYKGTFDETWNKFAAYAHYGYAPPFIQKSLWGEMFLILARNNSGEIDVRKAFEKYKTKFSGSSYLPHIAKLLNVPIAPFTGTFITKDYATLNELWLGECKGMPVFIDLWATWCAPCTEEFQYKQPLEDFLKTKGVRMLYLSMDEGKNKGNWQKQVQNFQLNAANHLAGEALKKDILASIYKSTDWAIPRYILINNKGNIVLADAYRPSDGEKLYQQITSAL